MLFCLLGPGPPPDSVGEEAPSLLEEQVPGVLHEEGGARGPRSWTVREGASLRGSNRACGCGSRPALEVNTAPPGRALCPEGPSRSGLTRPLSPASFSEPAGRLLFVPVAKFLFCRVWSLSLF